MSLPIFFTTAVAALNQVVTLDEDTSRHVSQVLRMQRGELLQLTNGKGTLLTAEIEESHKKRSAVRITNEQRISRTGSTTSIAISLLKNANRFEWFLEKATELGIHQIIPLICERTERQHFRMDRMQSVLVSAMLQSQQAWLPEMPEPQPFKQFIQEAQAEQKFIAHCMNDDSKRPLRELVNTSLTRMIMIGPEGDFSKEEIELATTHGCMPVSLGSTRLRTETAGIAAAAYLV